LRERGRVRGKEEINHDPEQCKRHIEDYGVKGFRGVSPLNILRCADINEEVWEKL